MATGGDNCDTEQSCITSIDIYRLSKDNLIELLGKFGIFADDFDNVANLRAVSVLLKCCVNAAKRDSRVRGVLTKIIAKDLSLTGAEIERYPDLHKLSEEINRREGARATQEPLYDNIHEVLLKSANSERNILNQLNKSFGTDKGLEVTSQYTEHASQLRPEQHNTQTQTLDISFTMKSEQCPRYF